MEFGANVLVTVSIVLAARNSVHTWWTGIVGCALFAWVFWDARLYADTILQIFFLAASAAGWWNWVKGLCGQELPVRSSTRGTLTSLTVAGLVLTFLWATLLERYTDAAAPLADSAVLCLSVIAQLLLMGRRIESWFFWIGVNSIAVPLFWSRGLHLTALLYAFYWLNAWWGFARWKRVVGAAA